MKVRVAGGQRITITDMAATIGQLAGSASDIRHTSERPGDVKHSVASWKGCSPPGRLPGTIFGRDGGPRQNFTKLAGRDVRAVSWDATRRNVCSRRARK